MAFSIIQQPAALTPIFNDMNIVVYDTNYAALGYQYVFKISAGYSPLTLSAIGDINVYPEVYTFTLNGYSYTNFGRINLDRRLQDYILTTYNNNPGIYTDIDKIYYQVDFYYKTSTTPKTSLSSNVSGCTWNGCASSWKNSLDITTYVSAFEPKITSPYADIMNIKNYNRNIRLTDYATLTFKASGTYETSKIRVETNTGKRFDKTVSVSGLLDHNIINIGVGPANINSTTWTTVTPGGSTITSSDSYYDVYIFESSTKRTHKIVRYNIVTDCIYDYYRVDYQALNGGFNYIPFIMKHYKTISSKKEIYEKKLPYTPAQTDIGSKVFSNTVMQSIELNTDWLTQEEVDEVEEMILSPVLYLIDKDNLITPIVLLSVKKDIKKVSQDKLVQYNFEFEYANKIKTLI